MKYKKFLTFITLLATSAAATADLNTGLLAYYPFNGNANDSSGNGNNGMVNGATLTTDRFGNVNSAYNFDGGSNYIDLTNTKIAIQGNAARTFIAWIKTTYTGGLATNPGWQAIIATGTPSPSQAFNLTMYSGCSNGTVGIMGYLHDFYPCSGSSGIVNTDGAWHMTAVVYDGLGNLSIYADGILDNMKSINYTTTGQNNYIGKSHHVGNSYPFHGSIDDVRIYNRALSASEIQQLYQQEDSSGSNSLSASIDRMTSQSGSITCTNWTTGNAKILKIIKGVTQWDCEKAGLIVNKGDKIQIKATVNGIAK